MALRVASWNVNSLRVRLPQVLRWLEATQTDALVLQETKLTDDQFPQDAFQSAGFEVAFVGQKTYNGVALITRRDTLTVSDVVYNVPGFPDEQKRLVSATLTPKATPDKPFTMVGGYIPNGNELGSWKYLYKLDWLAALEDYLRTCLAHNPRLVMGGDFNIAPEDRDVWDPVSWHEKVLTSKAERYALDTLLALGLVDSFRALVSDKDRFSWWDYRQAAFERNHGLRIDLLLVSEAMKADLAEVGIDTEPRGWDQPSDHAPVWVSFKG